jgi:hypothetical protein
VRANLGERFLAEMDRLRGFDQLHIFTGQCDVAPSYGVARQTDSAGRPLE